MDLIAYDLAGFMPQRLEPAPLHRDWIDRLPEKFARRCLPMMIANQSGWEIVTAERVEAAWTGATNEAAVTATGGGTGIFGAGILTFNIRWLFRTPPGWNLLARGPANRPKDGISPLEGVVETDWASQTFTMNWQFTRPGHVVFEVGEPICFVVPQQRGALEAFEPVVRPIEADPKTKGEFAAFNESRSRFRATYLSGWQKDYHRGLNVGSDEPAEGHQRKLRLRPFS